MSNIISTNRQPNPSTWEELDDPQWIVTKSQRPRYGTGEGRGHGNLLPRVIRVTEERGNTGERTQRMGGGVTGTK